MKQPPLNFFFKCSLILWVEFGKGKVGKTIRCSVMSEPQPQMGRPEQPTVTLMDGEGTAGTGDPFADGCFSHMPVVYAAVAGE